MGWMAHGDAGVGIADRLAALLDEDGCASHPYARQILRVIDPESRHDLADAAHMLCMLHGRYPGVIDHAADRTPQPEAREWLYAASAGFAAERGFLTRLVVAVGPLPSTPGQAQSEAAVVGQRHALATLSQSERNGTALGAAIALVLDWTAARAILDVAAERSGVVPPPLDLSAPSRTMLMAESFGAQPAPARALCFGAEQLLIQHRGLWSLLEARSSARRSA